MSEQRIPSGIYTARAIAGSAQYGTTKNGNDQIAVDLLLSNIDQTATTFLIFTDASAPFAIDRLRALGWAGDDLSNLDGIDANEVNVAVKYETWEGKERMRVEIVTGGGRVVLQNAMDEKGKRAFAAKFRGFVAAGPRPVAAGPAKGGADDPAGFPFGHMAPDQKKASGVKL